MYAELSLKPQEAQMPEPGSLDPIESAVGSRRAPQRRQHGEQRRGRDLRMLTIIVAFETLSVDRAQKLQGRC
jgi:hypothetical protein